MQLVSQRATRIGLQYTRIGLQYLAIGAITTVYNAREDKRREEKRGEETHTRWWILQDRKEKI